MHPAADLAEAPPQSEKPHAGHQQTPTNEENKSQGHNQNHNHIQNPNPNHNHNHNHIQNHQAANATLGSENHNQNHGIHPDGASFPARKDTTSSISTTGTNATLATLASDGSATTAYSVDQSPKTPVSAPGAASFNFVANEVSQRRASRRRTGPLSAVQRERAALIRKLGACHDCRRRRVACHPDHHNTTWEEAAKKFRNQSPAMQELAPRNGRTLSPAPLNANPRTHFTHDPHDMDIDVSPTQPSRMSLSDPRIRTPLPSGPRPDKPPNMAPISGADNFKASDLQEQASRILANHHRGRYTAVSALLVHWEDDNDRQAIEAMQELARVLKETYNYTCQIISIPPSSDDCTSLQSLHRSITGFVDDRDKRDNLKIVYYTGHSYLDGNREMVIASPTRAEPSSAIRWSAIQQTLENARSDILVVMDSAYYHTSSKPSRREGVLELIAASASEDHSSLLGRSAFTRAFAEQLQCRAIQTFKNPYTAAEIHVKLLSVYSRIIRDRTPEKEVVTSFPSPLHLQVSGNPRLPSILLAPLPKPSPILYSPESPTAGTHISLTFRLSDEGINMANKESWTEWFRWMPEGIRGVKVEGPYRNTL
ncbi:hypothetical protein B0H67DRAFT_638903 [Lasiosphaeris hirsuta]|uniref:Uncharacterized protein n=1 Tax=Lasiosphaeris hirsuta TaxID=260670 RepID=A0AA40BA18_9PEZI|nr:hypothetical protein B0H67DRAFT_638903 [Lasiosphaeris hirsuta]